MSGSTKIAGMSIGTVVVLAGGAYLAWHLYQTSQASAAPALPAPSSDPSQGDPSQTPGPGYYGAGNGGGGVPNQPYGGSGGSGYGGSGYGGGPPSGMRMSRAWARAHPVEASRMMQYPRRFARYHPVMAGRGGDPFSGGGGWDGSSIDNIPPDNGQPYPIATPEMAGGYQSGTGYGVNFNGGSGADQGFGPYNG